MQPNSPEPDRTLVEQDEYVFNLDPASTQEMSFSESAVEPAMPLIFVDSPHPFDSPPLQAPLDTQWADEHTQNSFFVVYNGFYVDFFSPTALQAYEHNILAASASFQPLPPPSPFPSPGPTFLPPVFWKIQQLPYKQGREQWDFRRVKSVVFRVNGYPGVSVVDALRNKFSALEDRDEPVLQDGRTAFSCRFLFPGCPPSKAYQIFTKRWNKGSDPIVRSQLANHIARKLKEYLDSVTSSQTAGGSPNGERLIDQGMMAFKNMYLAKLDCVSKGSFQPEIWVMDPMFC